MKTAIMFAGQGSQYTNMGYDLLTSKEYEAKVNLASSILGFNVIDALKNENEELSQTKYTQPLIAVLSMIIFDHFESLNYKAQGFLGFSLGEIVALYASKILSFEDTIKLIKTRAELMEVATIKYPGKMTAVLNMDVDVIKGALHEDVIIANYNSKKQVVISGTNEGILKTKEKLSTLGARRLIDLNVSGAFHSKLMSEAGTKLNEYSLSLTKTKNKYPVYLNSSTNILNYLNLNVELEKQIQSPVYFYQSIEKMIEDGFELFIEIGPGKVLSTILAKNYVDVKTLNIENIDDFEKLKGMI